MFMMISSLIPPAKKKTREVTLQYVFLATF